MPSPVDCRDDIPESEQPPRKRLYLSTIGSRYEIRESSTARPTRGRGIDYGFVSTIDAEERRQGVVELAELHERDTQDLYALLEDAQDGDSMDGGGGGLCFPRGLGSFDRIESANLQGASDQIEIMLYAHEDLYRHTRHSYSCRVLSFRHSTRRQDQMVETLRVIRDMRREMSDMQAELLALREQRRIARQSGPEARVPDHQEASRDADRNVKAAKPKTLDETIELANDLMDQKLLTYAESQSDNKRRADDSSRNNHNHQQQPFKRQNVAKVYNMGTGKKKPYGGSLPKNTGNTNVANTQKGNGATPKGNGCFECGAPGHFKRDCPKLKNKNGGNGNAQGLRFMLLDAE
ncbi:putative reverse transcriptase domain-containing protein [Tanacetum coccineum]|uniref:Reverse transcriptase domain-containing protein n=1 Tax=Tanacetum coccineum TaxID=301880 RepID=A0ABQ5I147_9ASTR